MYREQHPLIFGHLLIYENFGSRAKYCLVFLSALLFCLHKGYNDMLKGRTRPAAMVLSDVKKKYKV
jgi:hypothetical protein